MLIDVQPDLTDCRTMTEHGWQPMQDDTRRDVMAILDAEYVEERDSRRTQGAMWQGTAIVLGLFVVIVLAGIARVGHVDTAAEALPRTEMRQP